MALEEVQHRAGEQAHRQEGHHEAHGVHPDEQKASGRAAGGGGHQQHAAQGGAHAGRPGKAEGEAQHQGHQGIHGPAIQPEGQSVLVLQGPGAAEHAELIQAKKDHDDAADAGKPGLIPGEEGAQGGEAEPQQEEGKADPHHKEDGVHQHPAPGVTDIALVIHGLGAPGQIAYIQGHQGQHTGGEKAEKPLYQHGKYGYAGLQCKSHGHLLLNKF